MKLREIVLAGAMLLSSAAFSQNKIYFDVYTGGDGFFSPRLNSSSIKADSNEIDCSFLFGIYSMKFKKINDSTYHEIVGTNFLWISKEELFDYSFKNSCYTLKKYSVSGEKPREEKKILEGTVFNKKYKIPPEIFNDFKKGLIKDSLHFIILGMPYSVKIESTKKGEEILYFCNPPEIKEEPGDFFIFSYPVELLAKKEGEKIIPFEFRTKVAKTKKGIIIEGILREDRK